MREQVFAALGGGDEAEALGVVEPLDGTGCHVYSLPLLVAATIPGATKPGKTIKGREWTATTSALNAAGKGSSSLPD
jgi:hypothetical protein